MNSRDFVYWLRGYLELSSPKGVDKTLTHDQVVMIENHLKLVQRNQEVPRIEGINLPKLPDGSQLYC